LHSPTSPSMPPQTRWALRVLWGCLITSAVTGMWREIAPVVETTLVSAGTNDSIYRVTLATALLALLLLFTPKFIGILVGAGMLLLVARKQHWSRWVLVLGVAGSGMLEAHTISGFGVSSLQFPALVLNLVLLVLMAAAVGFLFSSETAEWIRSGPKKDASQVTDQTA
jgi:hypothetical protein